MREILFRGKTVNGNEWVIGAGVYKSEGYTWIITDDVTKTENRGTGSDAIIPKTVGQYTGLTDKNGKKIFEGDIIDTPDRLIKVVWFEANAQFDLVFVKHAHNKNIINFRGIYMRDLKEYEVIGNIHDNPELLKGEIE